MSTHLSSPSHALILEGDGRSVRHEALLCAAAWLCPTSHPPGQAVLGPPCRHCTVCRHVLSTKYTDLHTPDEGADNGAKVDAVRNLRKTMLLQPMHGSWSCAVFFGGDKLGLPAQNALLTLLEEPPAHARLILCAKNAAALLPTVRSRCTVFTLSDQDESAPKPAHEEAARAWLAALDDDWARLTISMTWEKLSRDSLRAQLSVLLAVLRDAITEADEPRHGKLMDSAALCLKMLDALDRNISPGNIAALLALGAHN